MASVDTGRLLASVFLSLVTIVLIGTVAALLVLDQFEPKAAAAAAGFLAVYLLSAAGVDLAPAVGPVDFVAVEAPEGVRIRRGLLQTISETVPYGRIQAVRQVEPLLWRPFGWCRLEVDVAGATEAQPAGRGRQRRPQGAAAGRIATGLLAPAGAAAGRARPGAHGPAGAGPGSRHR